MIALLVIVTLIGGAYFFFHKRTPDLLTVGFLGSLVYFMPGFFLEYDTALGHVVLPDAQVLMFSIVLASITATAYFVDNLGVRVKPLGKIAYTEYVPVIATWFMLASFAILFRSYGLTAFTEGKNESDVSGFLTIIMRVTMSLAVVFSVAYKYKFGTVTGIICMVIYLLLGDRTAAATIALAALIIGFSQEPHSLFLKYKRFWWAGIAFGMLMTYGKLIYALVRPTSGDRIQIVSEYISTKNPITTTEPFVTQIILKRVIESDFHVGTKYLSHIPLLILPITGQIGNDFNKEFQPQLFPTATTYGLAHNFWAEGYSIGGWFGFFVFDILYILGLMMLGWLVKSECKIIRAFGAMCGSYWGIYIQRNSIFNILTFEKQFLYFGLLILAIGLLLGHAAAAQRAGRSAPEVA